MIILELIGRKKFQEISGLSDEEYELLIKNAYISHTVRKIINLISLKMKLNLQKQKKMNGLEKRETWKSGQKRIQN